MGLPSFARNDNCIQQQFLFTLHFSLAAARIGWNGVAWRGARWRIVVLRGYEWGRSWGVYRDNVTMKDGCIIPSNFFSLFTLHFSLAAARIGWNGVAWRGARWRIVVLRGYEWGRSWGVYRDNVTMKDGCIIPSNFFSLFTLHFSLAAARIGWNGVAWRGDVCGVDYVKTWRGGSTIWCECVKIWWCVLAAFG